MNNLNSAISPNIKHNSTEVGDGCYFAERVRHMLDILLNGDMIMIRTQALQQVQGQIPDLILDNVTTDYPFYDDDK